MSQVRNARRADAAGVGLLLVLAAGGATVRPLLRALHPPLAGLLAAREAFERGAPVDPWGLPWLPFGGYVSDPRLADPWIHGWASAGPDRRPGTLDDIEVGLSSRSGARRMAWRTEEDQRYHDAALPFHVLAGALVVTRLASRGVPRRRSRAVRLASAAGLALVPATALGVTLSRRDLLEPLAATAELVAVPREVAVFGSAYAALVLLVFVHRELGDTPPITPPEGERGAGDPGASQA